MTVQRPGSVQAQEQGHASRSDLARRGKCCCCCSLRSGVITLSILLLIKGVILSAQWYWFSENYASYYNYSDDSSDSNNQMSMGMGMHSSSSNNNDNNVPVSSSSSSSSDDEVPSREGGSGMSHEGNQDGEEQQGGQQGGQQEGSQGSQEGGQDGKGQVMETQVMEQDEEEMGYESDEYVEVDFEIPTWVSALVWACVAWHFIGGLFGTFGACSYSKCCSFSFYVWWLLTITVAFAIGVLYFIYGSFHWCMFIAFSIAMIIGSYFTCKSKKWYNVLRDDIPAPQGYAGIEYENSV